MSGPEVQASFSVRANLLWEHGRDGEVLAEMSIHVDRGLAPRQKVQRAVGKDSGEASIGMPGQT